MTNRYIDAYKLIDEIEKRQEVRQDRRDTASWENEYWPEGEFYTRDNEDDAILSIIDSLQKEQQCVDLKKEIVSVCERYGITEYLDAELGPLDVKNIALYFYELGLNVRKEK